ncbi:MAG: hypothetical protein MZV70_41730 [Desulfobacterales bacterium]|nr:hypothetical protein [Desulfobacterales bacterium]
MAVRSSTRAELTRLTRLTRLIARRVGRSLRQGLLTEDGEAACLLQTAMKQAPCRRPEAPVPAGEPRSNSPQRRGGAEKSAINPRSRHSPRLGGESS